MKLSDIPQWIDAHPLQAATYAYGFLSAIVGATPEAWQKKPWVGVLLKILERISGLTHRDSAGTLKLPGATAVARATPPVPPVPLVVLLLLVAGCPKLPPVSGCTPGAQRCEADGPEVCSSTQRWHRAGDVACSAVVGACVVRNGIAVCARATADGGVP